MLNERIVFTIGHSTHPVERFVALLLRHGITAVSDVRSVPYSRMHPQFNRETLMANLKEHDIAYVFLGEELGARSQDKTCYENGRVLYRRLAETEAFRSGLERVLMGSKSHRIAIMCAEREPLECHRTLLIARELVAAGIRVLHIHADGRLEDHADAIGRLVSLLGLSEPNLFQTQPEQIEEAYARQEANIAYREKEAAGKGKS